MKMKIPDCEMLKVTLKIITRSYGMHVMPFFLIALNQKLFLFSIVHIHLLISKLPQTVI